MSWRVALKPCHPVPGQQEHSQRLTRVCLRGVVVRTFQRQVV